MSQQCRFRSVLGSCCSVSRNSGRTGLADMACASPERLTFPAGWTALPVLSRMRGMVKRRGRFSSVHVGICALTLFQSGSVSSRLLSVAEFRKLCSVRSKQGDKVCSRGSATLGGRKDFFSLEGEVPVQPHSRCYSEASPWLPFQGRIP